MVTRESTETHRTPAAIERASEVQLCSERAAGRVVVVAAPGGVSMARELLALHAAGIVTVPVRSAVILVDMVRQLRPEVVMVDVATCPTSISHVVAELAGVDATGVIVYGELLDPVTRAALLYEGADDCVISPYLLDELVARVWAVMRRADRSKPASRNPDILIAGSLRVDVTNHSVTIDNEPIALTLIEFRLLAYLLRHRGVALPRQRLLADVWGYTIGTLETVTVHVSRLRSKIDADPSRPAWIETVWGVGYRFRGEHQAISSPVFVSSSIPLATAG